MTENEKGLEEFFIMFDAIEDDIDELISDENKEPIEIGGYECLFIAFSNLRLFCNNAGINLEQIEDQFKALKESSAENKEDMFMVQKDLNANDEIISFCKLMEQIEDSFSAFEDRHEKSGEVFDAWTCVFIMYSYLKNYCEKEGVNSDHLMEDIKNLHAEMENNENP